MKECVMDTKSSSIRGLNFAGEIGPIFKPDSSSDEIYSRRHPWRRHDSLKCQIADLQQSTNSTTNNVHCLPWRRGVYGQ
jgi:uncharacterized protein YhbP (UPF0306 family)